jgi:multicomponent K+:H+ antiporter subunit A
VRSLAYLILPLSIVVAATHVLYGHDRPGDGFTAGVILSLAVGLWYIAFGYEETRRRLTWLRSAPLIGSGMLLMILGGAAAGLQTGSFLGPADFGADLGLPLPKGVHLSSALVFEVAIALAVLGSASWILDTLGHPSDPLPQETPAAGKED